MSLPFGIRCYRLMLAGSGSIGYNMKVNHHTAMTITTAPVAAPSTLFRQGWKAELYFGDDVIANHMNTSSVYTFRANPNITVTHSAPYGVNGDWETSVDQFIVSETHSHQYHESGALFTSVTSTVGTFNSWLGAYYCALENIRQLDS